MQQLTTSIPGYRIFEYLLVLSPHEELANQLREIQKEFAVKFKTEAVHQPKPQLALVRFKAFEMTQPRIHHRLQMIARGITPFKVEVEGFGAFPTHTIYANVTTRLPIVELNKALKTATSLLTLNKEHKPHFIEDAQLAICQKLKPWQFEQGWLEYSHRHFSGRFIADSLLLLKRPDGEKGYKRLMQFAFQNLAVNTKQGNLF